MKNFSKESLEIPLTETAAESLNKVIISKDSTKIGNYAFDDCSINNAS